MSNKKMIDHKNTVSRSLDSSWRVFVGAQIVNTGDKIEWTAVGSDMIFGIPKGFEEYFVNGNDLFTGIDSSLNWPEPEIELTSDEWLTKRIVEGESMHLEINPEVEDGRIVPYNIYVINEQTFVVGNSPQRIVIQRPYQ